MKRFVDRWSQTLKDQNYPNFKTQMSQKQAYIIAVGGDNPRVKGCPLIDQFKYIFQFIGLDFQGYLLGEGLKPNDILQDKQALEDANKLGERLKQQLQL